MLKDCAIINNFHISYIPFSCNSKNIFLKVDYLSTLVALVKTVMDSLTATSSGQAVLPQKLSKSMLTLTGHPPTRVSFSAVNGTIKET